MDLSGIQLPEKATAARKIRDLAVTAAADHGEATGDKVLLYGLLRLVALLEEAGYADANLRKALKEIFPKAE